MSIKLTIHSTGSGTCALTGKEGSDGLTVTFDDQTVKEGFLSWKAFRQLLGMKAGQTKAPPAEHRTPPGVPQAVMPAGGNGPAK